MSSKPAGKSRTGSALSAAALATALLAAGCSSGSLLGAPQPQPSPQPEAAADAPRSSSFRERMTALFAGRPAPQANAEAPPVSPVAGDDCPTIDVRPGASTYAVGPPGAEPTAATLRFQASVARTARECSVLAGNMTVKVGVQGRVILGPAGTPGPIEVPLRLALVQEGVEPKTVWTKAYRVPVTIPPNQSNVPFVHVEEDITFPLPKPDELAAYVVYVGFDPALIKEPEKKPPPKKKPRAPG